MCPSHLALKSSTRKILFCAIALFTTLASLPGASATPRHKLLINSDWLFELGDHAGAENTIYDDSSWQKIGLPHSFGIPYFGTSNFYVGYGWYRKHLRIDPRQPDQRIFLEFEGAFQDAEVVVNGSSVGRHQGGYTGFSFDVTRAMVAGDNVIAVRLNNIWNPRLNPRAGEHNFNGGLYRNVYLVTTSDLHVDWYGTFVTTPGLTATGGVVDIKTEVSNASAHPRSFTLRTDILDSSGHRVLTVTSHERAQAGTVHEVQQRTAILPRPQLWSPKHPNMYTAVSHLLNGKREVDIYTTPFGFRWIRWTADQGFFLNGEHDYFHGADVHQDHAGWGDAVTNAGIARDVRLVKEAGMDFIRGSHYPHSPVFADECDRQGVLFWSENSFWGVGGAKTEGTWTASAYPPNPEDQKPFEENVKRSLAEMIRINRNHPSIVAWSMTNEVFFSNANLLPRIRTFLQELVAESHQLDPSRPAGAGGVQRGGLDKLSDIAGYNGDGARLFLDPGVPSVVSEYGSLDAERPGPYEPGWGELNGQPQFTWRSGQALWCAFDHGSIYPSLGHTGMIDYFRVPKRQWYWYRNAYRGIRPPEWPREGKPTALHLATDRSGPIRADGSDDMQLIITVRGADGRQVSNDPPVKLEIVSGPGEFPTGRSITFTPDSDIVIRDGEAAMEMRAYQSGRIVVRATSPGLDPAQLITKAEGGPPFIPGKTPLVSDRPYTTAGLKVPAGTGITDISINRPTGSSSDTVGHSSRMANDGDPATYWESNASGQVWWAVDFESRSRAEQIRILFPDARTYRYIVQISDNSVEWKTLLDRRATDSTAIERIDSLPEEAVGRKLRLVFEPLVGGSNVKLSEVLIRGEPLVK
jgi:beta-galactosidase